MSALINQARIRVPRLAEQAVDRARLSVVPRRVAPATRVPFVVLVSLVLVTGVAGLLTFNTSLQQASFTATALEARADALAAREQSLRMELERLRDPQRVAVEARQMGMVPPANPAFVRLSDGQVLGDPTAAVPTDAVRIIDLPTPKPRMLAPAPVIVRAARANNAAHLADSASSAGPASLGAADRLSEAGTGTTGQRGDRTRQTGE